MLWNYLLKKFTQILRIVFETSLLQYCSIINNSEPGFHIKLSFGQNVAKGGRKWLPQTGRVCYLSWSVLCSDRCSKKEMLAGSNFVVKDSARRMHSYGN